MSAGTVIFVEEVPAGSVLITAAPRVANPVPNPSFEVDLATWISIGGTNTRQVAVPAFGTASLHVIGTSSGHGVEFRALNVVNGRRYYLRSNVTAYTAGPGSASLRVSDGANVSKGIVSRTSVGVLELEFVADADATDWKIRLLTNGGAADFNMDAIGFGEINAAGEKIPYVDGTFAGYGWAGTAHNSATVELASLYVSDPTDFQPEGGELLVGGIEEKGYSIVDEATGRITLDSNLSGTFAEDDRVDTLPLALERFAHVQLEEQDEVLIARVPHSLYDRMPVGARDENVDDAELVELGRDPGGELVVDDVLNREPLVDANFLDPTTTPNIPTSDGLAPSSSPTPIVRGGVGSLFVNWTPIGNHDLVVYEVHISTSSGFTPGVGTYAGETPGSFFLIEKLPGTTNRPAYGTTYFVRLVAKDEDGAGVVGTEGSGSPVQVVGPDLAANSVVAGKIAANAVTAGTLESVLALTSALLAGTPTAQRVEIGYGQDGGVIDPTFIGIRAYAVDGTTQTFRVDAITGEVYVKGRVDFGSTLPDGSGASRLLDSDILELAQQTATSFLTPTPVQTTGKEAGFGSSVTIAWPTPTQAGNLLLAVVMTRQNPPPTHTTPSGWTLVTSVLGTTVAGSALRLSVFKIENSASRSGNQTFSFSGATSQGIVQMLEYSGADVQDVAAGPADVEATSSGQSTTVTSGTPPTPTVANELWVAFLGMDINGAGGNPDTLTSPTNGYTQRRTSRDGSFLTRLTAYDRAVTAIASPAMQATAAFSAPFVGAVVAFKAKTAPANVAADRADTVRYWARDVSGTARPHFTLEDGTPLAVLGGKAGEVWEVEIISVAVNFPNTAAHAGGVQNITGVTGLAVGDYAFIIGADDNIARSWVLRTRMPVITAAQLDVDYFNADSAAADPASFNLKVLVIHRS